jgi:hypothetical protein
MTTFKLETPTIIDQEQLATIFGDIAKVLREDDDFGSKELMDGSFRIETTHGEVFITPTGEE